MPKISELPVGITATGTEIIPAVQSAVTVGLTSAQLVNGLSRSRLTANLSYFVASTGSDTLNTGLSVGSPFLTIQKALDVAAAQDLGLFSITINVAAGTYTGQITLKSFVGAGTIAILGSGASTCTISVTSGFCVLGAAIIGQYSLNGFKLVTNTAGFTAVQVQGSPTRLALSNIEFGASGAAHIFSSVDAFCVVNTSTTISGNANIHWYCTTGGVIFDAGHTITLTGTPVFAQAFAFVQSHGRIAVNANTFVGTATGIRYYADTLGLIDTQGGGANYLPGNVAGSTATGAVYN